MPADDVSCTSRPGCSCDFCSYDRFLPSDEEQLALEFLERYVPGTIAADRIRRTEKILAHTTRHNDDYAFMEYHPYEWESDRCKVIAARNEYARMNMQSRGVTA